MKIDVATANDADLVVQLVNCLIEELGGGSLNRDLAASACLKIISDPGSGLILIAREDGQAIGVCTLSFQDAIRTLGRYAIIQEMYVVPTFRSQAIGARLIERAVAKARAHGCSIVELGTPPDGQRQEQFYRKVGFSPVGLRFRMRT